MKEKSPKAHIAVKVPAEIKQRLKEKAEKDFTSESSLVRQALDVFLPPLTQK
jgi:predicted transcriptional regulator